MTYAFARIGAVVSMRVEDDFANGKRLWMRLHEKRRRDAGLKPSSMSTIARPAQGGVSRTSALQTGQDVGRRGTPAEVVLASVGSQAHP
jgi:hypothetical protein